MKRYVSTFSGFINERSEKIYNSDREELLTESIVGKIFDRLGYTDEVLKR